MDVDIPKTSSAQQNSGTLSGGGQHAPGAGRTNGGTGGSAGGRSLAGRSRFDAAVVNNGYRWWYIDATSDDGLNGLTIIAFVGSVFSPYYAKARKRGITNPENHCAINVALYGQHRRWAMTERGTSHINRTPSSFTVGSSAMSWENDSLIISIEERCTPLPFALKGRVIFTPDCFYNSPIELDQRAKHFWQAVAPHGHITVEFENPALSWSGRAYHDMNWGHEPLEYGFKTWSWCRAISKTGTKVLYDLLRRDGTSKTFGHLYNDGTIKDVKVPSRKSLSRGYWGMTREVNSEAQPVLLATLEDTPFYTRNHIAMTVEKEQCEAVHESLSLDRFTHPITQMMLPFRMPRAK
jgi:carotenoid 1,2-hydratase